MSDGSARRKVAAFQDLKATGSLTVKQGVLDNLKAMKDINDLKELGKTVPEAAEVADIFDVLKKNVPDVEFSWYGSGVSGVLLGTSLSNDYDIAIVPGDGMDIKEINQKVSEFTSKVRQGKIKDVVAVNGQFEYKGKPVELIGVVNKENLIQPFDGGPVSVNLSMNTMGVTSEGRFMHNEAALNDLQNGEINLVAAKGSDVARQATWIDTLHRALRVRHQTGFNFSDDTKEIVGGFDYESAIIPSVAIADKKDLKRLKEINLTGGVNYTHSLAGGIDGTFHRLYRDSIDPRAVTKDLEVLGLTKTLGEYVDFVSLEKQAITLAYAKLSKVQVKGSFLPVKGVSQKDLGTLQDMFNRYPEIQIGDTQEIEIISGTDALLVSKPNGKLVLHQTVLNNPIAENLVMDIAFNGKDGIDAQADNIVNRVQRYIEAPENKGNGKIGIRNVDRIANIIQTEGANENARELAKTLIADFQKPTNKSSSSPIDRAQVFKPARSSTDPLISSPVIQERGINISSLSAGDPLLQHILTMAAPPPPPRDKKLAVPPPPKKKPRTRGIGTLKEKNAGRGRDAQWKLKTRKGIKDSAKIKKDKAGGKKISADKKKRG
ncbi:MAG: hypothetical protein KAI70_08465, partial [Candidatus Omnitrophica bacterium]|nr:hypothetical protein [Candidatus Omnitrophota bacterium]